MAGTEERVTLSGLNAGTRYYLAIRTEDNDGNWSQLSNVFIAETAAGPDTIAPAAITTLSVSLPSGDVNTAPVIDAVSGAQSPTAKQNYYLDGQMGTDWYTAREVMQGEEVDDDLGVEVLMEEIVLTASSFFPELFPQTYTLSVSLDGDNYQIVASGAATDITSNAVVSHTFNATQGQFVKLKLARRPVERMVCSTSP